MPHRVAVDSLQDTLHLAIETTSRLGSIALFKGLSAIRHTNLDPQQRTAASLAPELDATLAWCREHECWPKFVSVADGPGSFTGLRVGVTTAKTLAYALDLPLIAVDSLAAIAAAAMDGNPDCDSVLVAIDAYRQQYFAGTFGRSDLLPPINAVPRDWTAHRESVRVWPEAEWGDFLRALPTDIALAGDDKPLQALSQRRLERRCDAIGVGLVAVRAAALGTFIDPLSLVPRYLKASAAEEKAAKGTVGEPR